MKIKKPDGTIIELSSVTKRKEEEKTLSYQDKLKKRMDETQERIEERGTIQDRMRERFGAGSGSSTMGQKAIGALEVLATPANAIESAVSNVGLKVQKRALKDPNVSGEQAKLLRSLLAAKDLAGEAWSGLTLQKQGQYGDVFKTAGLDPMASDAVGLFLNVAGTAKLLSAAGRTFGSISKMSDRGIIQGGKHLIRAADEARKVVGNQAGQAFLPVVDDVVDGVGFYDEVAKLPQAIRNGAEEVFGKMEDFANNLTIGKLREFKQWIGKLRAGKFGKVEKGAVETLEDSKVDDFYGFMKQTMQDTIKETRGEKVAKNLMALEENFSKVDRAGKVIRKAVIDPTLRMPTRGGKVAEGLVKEGDVTTRTALNIIKKSSWEANKSINNAVRLLELYNRNRLASALLQSAVKAATFGGAAGAVGGGALRKVTRQD